VLAAILAPESPDLSGLPESTPAPLAAIVRRCLEKDPERRPSSAHDLALQLRDLQAAGTSSPGAARPAPRGRKKAIDSVAVLPLVDASPAAGSEYLADGVTESIIHVLSDLPRLRVMALSTVSRYREATARGGPRARRAPSSRDG
jgi:serine/threonine-protein kinase